MKEYIIQREFYDILYCNEKNRFYFTILNFWRDLHVVPHYLEDWEYALTYCKPDFTILTDARNFKVNVKGIHELHIEAQKLLLENGLKMTAEILPPFEWAEYEANKINKKSNMPRFVFKSFQEAEDFLDNYEL